jgi:hypothetical protein
MWSKAFIDGKSEYESRVLLRSYKDALECLE